MKLIRILRTCLEVCMIIGFSYLTVHDLIKLHTEYKHFNVKQEVTTVNSVTISPPCISFCFKIMHILNATAIFQQHPNILSKVMIIKEEHENYRNWSYSDIIKSYDQGEPLIFGNLNKHQITEILRPVTSLFSSCHYLSVNFTLMPCNLTVFRNYFYDNSICFDFQYCTALNTTFKRSELRFPGFSGLSLIDVNLDFSSLPLINQVTLTAHRKDKIPYDRGESTIELQVPSKALIQYDLSFEEVIRKSLPAPYETRCTRPGRKFNGVGRCLDLCFIRNFINTTGRIPYLYVARKSTCPKCRFLYNQENLGKIQNFVSSLYKPCRWLCGFKDCHQEIFVWKKLGRPKEQNFPIKTTRIRIFAPSKNPKIYRDTPQISWLNYFSSSGSVIGLWFGLSALSLFAFIDQSLNAICYYIISKCLHKPGDNNKLRCIPRTQGKIKHCKSRERPQLYLTYVNSFLDNSIVNKIDCNSSLTKDKARKTRKVWLT